MGSKAFWLFYIWKYNYTGFIQHNLYAGRNDYGNRTVIISCLFPFLKGRRHRQSTDSLTIKKEWSRKVGR